VFSAPPQSISAQHNAVHLQVPLAQLKVYRQTQLLIYDSTVRLNYNKTLITGTAYTTETEIAQSVSRGGRPGFDCRQVQDIALVHRVQTGSDAHTAFYPTDTEGSFPGGKAGWSMKLTLTSI
jgi:hypothetical protein